MAAKDSWHLSRSVSLSHIGSTVLAVIAIVMYVNDVKTDVALNASKIENIKESNHNMFTRIDKNMDKLSIKMDRLFELFHESQDK